MATESTVRVAAFLLNSSENKDILSIKANQSQISIEIKRFAAAITK